MQGFLQQHVASQLVVTSDFRTQTGHIFLGVSACLQGAIDTFRNDCEHPKPQCVLVPFYQECCISLCFIGPAIAWRNAHTGHVVHAQCSALSSSLFFRP